jgi:hypothetical protein
MPMTLHQFLAQLYALSNQAPEDLDLAPFLERLHHGLQGQAATSSGLEPDEFLQWVSAAFLPGEDRILPDPPPSTQPYPVTTRSEVLLLLQAQIADLNDLSTSGKLEDPYRYFGISAPRCSTWYNFDVAGYLEAGMRGTWDDSFAIELQHGATGSVLEMDGTVRPLTEEERQPGPDRPMETLSWKTVGKFLGCGQSYE